MDEVNPVHGKSVYLSHLKRVSIEREREREREREEVNMSTIKRKIERE